MTVWPHYNFKLVDWCIQLICRSRRRFLLTVALRALNCLPNHLQLPVLFCKVVALEMNKLYLSAMSCVPDWILDWFM